MLPFQSVLCFTTAEGAGRRSGSDFGGGREAADCDAQACASRQVPGVAFCRLVTYSALVAELLSYAVVCTWGLPAVQHLVD